MLICILRLLFTEIGEDVVVGDGGDDDDDEKTTSRWG